MPHHAVGFIKIYINHYHMTMHGNLLTSPTSCPSTPHLLPLRPSNPFPRFITVSALLRPPPSSDSFSLSASQPSLPGLTHRSPTLGCTSPRSSPPSRGAGSGNGPHREPTPRSPHRRRAGSCRWRPGSCREPSHRPTGPTFGERNTRDVH